MTTNRTGPPSTTAAHSGRESEDIASSLRHTPMSSLPDVERLQAELRDPRHRVMAPTLEFLAQALLCSVYIEDVHGHLLFAPNDPTPDDWRDDFTPLSIPTSPDYTTALESWRRQSSAYVTLTGDRSVSYQRTVVPLVYHGIAFAFIHFVKSPSSGNSSGRFSDELVAAIADKLYMLFFGEMNEHREKSPHRATNSPTPPAQTDAPSHAQVVLEVARQSHCICFRTYFHLPTQNPTVAYSSIARRVGWSFARHIERERPEVVASQVSAYETTTGVELAVHTQAVSGQDPASVAAATRRVLRHLQWNLKVGIGFAEASDAAVESPHRMCERASREANVMLALAGRSSPGARQVLSRREAPTSSVMLFRDDSHSFRAYAAFIAQELEHAEPELVTTARTYALHDCNASATAEALQVDRRTVSDRLQRISQLSGLEFPSFASKVIIYLAFLSPAP